MRSREDLYPRRTQDQSVSDGPGRARQRRSRDLAPGDACLDVALQARPQAFATHLLQGGTDMRTMPQRLGHSDVATTQRIFHLL